MKIFTRSFIFPSFLIFILLSCQACFEIIEEINFNENGTGSFCLTINMSQSRLNINSLLLLDSVNGRKIPKVEDLKETLGKIESVLKKDTGINNVFVKQDWNNYIFSVGGNFKSIAALNRSINNVNTLFDKVGTYSPQIQDNYSYNNKTFKRLYNYNLVNNYHSLSEKDKAVFTNATYTSVFRFQTLIKSFSNPNASKSKSGKAIMLKMNVKDLITNIKSIENSISLN
jgi:hypothetical protein